MILIALTGDAGAGKDSTAAVLARYARFTPVAFADALRAEVADAFDIVPMRHILQEPTTKNEPHEALALRNCRAFGFIGAVAVDQRATVNSEWLDAPRSPRQVLQWWGTEYRRKQSPQYWTRAMAKRLAVMKSGGDDARVVITDCRYPNELQLAREWGGKLWRVHREGLPNVENGHSSARALADVKADVLIDNHGTREELRDEVLRYWWATDSGIDAHSLVVEVACPL